MPFGVLDSSRPVVTVTVTGEPKKSEFERVQGIALDSILRWGKIRVLVLLENFGGWERGVDWGDVTFAAEHDKDIEVAIEYFAPSELPRAREWLGR